MMLVIGTKQQLENVLTDYLSTVQYQHMMSEQVQERLANNIREGASNANQHNDDAIWEKELYKTTVTTLSTRESILENHPQVPYMDQESTETKNKMTHAGTSLKKSIQN